MLHLHHQHGTRLAHHEGAVAGLLGVVLGAREDLVVDELAARELHRRVGGRPQGVRTAPGPHGHERRAERLVDRPAVDTEQFPGRRERDEVELELDAHEEGAFRSGEEPAHVAVGRARRIQAGRVHQCVERVAGIAAGDLRPRERLADEPAVRAVAEHLADRAVDPRLERVGTGTLLREGGRVERAEGHLRAVGQEAARRDEMVAGGAVGDRVGAAGVVPHHPADRGPRRGGGLGTEEQAVRREEAVELVADDARLHAHAPPLDIEREDAIEVPCEVDDDPAADDLTGQGRARAAGHEADATLRREADERAHVGLGPRNRDGQRSLLILRRVGRVDRPREVIDEQVALERVRESLQIGDVHADGILGS